MKLEPLIQLSTVWVGTTERFGVHLFEGKLTLPDMDRLDAIGERWYRQNRGKTVELVIVFPSDARMTHEERVRMAKLMRRWETIRIASATTILADGLRGAAQRSVLTGLMLLAPAPHPAKVFGNVADAVRWLQPHVESACGPLATPAAVQSAVEEFSRDFRARNRNVG